MTSISIASPVRPEEAHTPLVVDADAVLTRPVTTERLEPVGWRHSKVGECRGRNHSLQSHWRPALDVMRQVTDRLSVEEPFCVTVPETFHYIL